eukprot:CAMPEP_0167740706 /NCGR_PEP_ID=MMETSP0110_2-20121227/435_1 /TAXON_ID=629695 /ORGANISM="Gymnochlora sp., Strain CCMP2014" /LENGTH=188 /DNA_ID=CAMNT_0007624647 /DNA_START=60 /DNA_END=623 /DNA_ORIENTATION=+
MASLHLAALLLPQAFATTIQTPSPATYVSEMRKSMDLAVYASLATKDVQGTHINSRIIFPKPTNVTGSTDLSKIYFATNIHSRKFKELQPTSSGPPSVNLLYWDREGTGYVSVRGLAVICDKEESTDEYWDGWDSVYPKGADTDFYNLIRIEPMQLEFDSARFDVDVGAERTDWRPLTLIRPSPGAGW